MKLIVSGKTKDFTPQLEQKFGLKIAKLGKFIEQRGEREAHVIHQLERHQHKVEMVVNFYDHSLVGEGIDSDLDTALCQALEKVEKQVVKLRERWRDTHRDAKTVRSTKESWSVDGANNTQPARANGKAPANGSHKANGKLPAKPKVFRVNYAEDRKPMTLEEAMLDLQRDPSEEYAVYQDSSRNCLSVLIRRTDGHFDLIES